MSNPNPFTDRACILPCNDLTNHSLNIKEKPMKLFEVKYNTPSLPSETVAKHPNDWIMPEKRFCLLDIFWKKDELFASLIDMEGKHQDRLLPIEKMREDANKRQTSDFLAIFGYIKSGAAQIIANEQIVYIPEQDKFLALVEPEMRLIIDWRSYLQYAAESCSAHQMEIQRKIRERNEANLTNKYVSELKVQAKCIKIKVKGSSSRNAIRRYASYDSLMRDIETSSGGTIRRVKNGNAKLNNSILYVFIDPDTAVHSDGIWTYVEDDKLYTFKIPAKSMDMYIRALHLTGNTLYIPHTST